jgi:hypothetical protein
MRCRAVAHLVSYPCSGALELESEEVRFKIEKKGTDADGNVEYDVQDVLPKKVCMVNQPSR